MIPIERAPIPTVHSRTAKGESKYPFAQLEVGESFFIPNRDANPPEHLMAEAQTMENMRNHVSIKNRYYRALPPGEEQRVFKCGYKENTTPPKCYIQVWRES